MVEKRKKYMRKTSAKMSLRLEEVVKLILAGDLADLDIVPLVGKKNYRRCRVGDIRIVFMRSEQGKYDIVTIKPRGDVYKG